QRLPLALRRAYHTAARCELQGAHPGLVADQFLRDRPRLLPALAAHGARALARGLPGHIETCAREDEPAARRQVGQDWERRGQAHSLVYDSPHNAWSPYRLRSATQPAWANGDTRHRTAPTLVASSATRSQQGQDTSRTKNSHPGPAGER